MNKQETKVVNELKDMNKIETTPKINLEKIGQHDNIRDYDFHHYLHYYKIDDVGHIIGLYIYNQGDPSLGLFPVQFCEFKYLEELYLSNNEIHLVPDSIGNLSSLRELDLSFNRIVNIPETFGKLHNLKYLDISYNNLKKLPEFFKDFPSLEVLSCSGNAIKEIPQSIIEKNQKNRNYYKKYN